MAEKKSNFQNSFWKRLAPWNNLNNHMQLRDTSIEMFKALIRKHYIRTLS